LFKSPEIWDRTRSGTVKARQSQKFNIIKEPTNQKTMEYFKSHSCEQLTLQNVGESVKLCGWIDRRRDHGGVIFLDLRDKSGIIQVTTTENFIEGLRCESVIQVKGIVVARPEGASNPRLFTGDVEIDAEQITILNAFKGNLPFQVSSQQPEEERVGEVARLKHRYLDLRSERMTKNLILRHKTTKVIRDFLETNGFIEVETPILTRPTSEGAREYLVPSRVCEGEWYSLPQSPQLFKQLLMIGGIERYYQFARCFRDEDLRSDRQPEFTQLDLEMGFITQEQIIFIMERLISYIWKTVKNIDLPATFPIITWKESMERYGTDRPDTRYGMELVTVNDIVKDINFKIFSNAVATQGSVKCITIPNGNKLISNVRIKPNGDIFEVAKESGANGLAFIRVRENEEIDTIGSIKDCFTTEMKQELFERTGAKPGDLILFAAGVTTTVNKVLDRVRQFLASDLDLIKEEKWNFIWVVDFPMFEYDPLENRCKAVHHPFCAPNPEDLEMASMRAQAYDLVLNGLELGGGSLRIHDSVLQRSILNFIGMTDVEIDEQFGFLLKALDSGAPPHGGIAFGLDRMIMLLAGESSIRDVIAFPKMQNARCHMSGAPSTVDKSQIEELNL
jgi:aspartyl-tRNA synthetase